VTRLHLIREVAVWEFRRWFKIRDQVITLVLSLVVGAAVWGGMALLARERARPVDVAVMGAETLPFEAGEDGRIRIADRADRSEDELRRAVADGELDALLILAGTEGATLVVRKEPGWLPELQAAMDEARRAEGLRRLELSQEELGALLAPLTIDVSYAEGSSGPTTRAAKVTAIVLVILMIVGVGLGLALQFVAITGEKQQRVTEQVVAAISPQTWIDGKILGISMVALASLVTYVVSAVAFVAISWLFGRHIPIPVGLVGPWVWLSLVAIALSGFLFWNTVYAAIAATVDDPNTSARGSLLMLPILPLVLAFFRMGSPDTVLTRAFAVFPLTSPIFLPMRLVLTEVPVWEVLLAIALLLGAVLLVRRAAGKIFGMGILMYGKEPGLAEMMRWIRSA
jgi:ABC-2 type transport system permease protein